MRRIFARKTLMIAVILGGAVAAPLARAEDKPPAAWGDTVKFSGFLDAGIMGNPDSPKSGINWGRLFDDRANTPQLNQAFLSLARATDPNATGYDLGFTLSAMFGSDARYTHFDGEFDRALKGRYQFTPVEADILLHLPWLTEAGIDAKIGQFPTLLTAEQTPATANPLYSHSYIFNFGAPFSHTGIWTITHVNPLIDVYLGIDTGNQTTLGPGDNNGALAGLTGLGLNLLDGKVTILWLNHMGPENPRNAHEAFNVNSAFRFYDTITTVVKWNDDLTLTTDLNWVRDNGFKADAYGIAQYASYVLNPMVTLQLRGEVWRDAQGFFVSAFPGNLDAVNALEGRPNTVIPGVSTTYAELTLGLNIKPPVPERFTGAVFRPEIRYDTTLNNAHPFDVNAAGVGTKGHQVTIGGDFILPF